MRARLTSHVLWTTLAALMLVPGCGQNTATAPSPARTAGPNTSSQTYERRLSGRVLDENGSPIPDATVVAYGFPAGGCCETPMPPSVTDGSGGYQTVATESYQFDGTDVVINAPAAGFEETDGFVAGTSDTIHDFRLFRPLTLAPGTDLHLRLDSDNSVCGVEEEFRCRSVHVTGPAGATVTVTTISDDPTQVVWLADSASSPYLRQTRLSASPGTVVQMLVPWTTSGLSFVIRATVQ